LLAAKGTATSAAAAPWSDAAAAPRQTVRRAERPRGASHCWLLLLLMLMLLTLQLLAGRRRWRACDEAAAAADAADGDDAGAAARGAPARALAWPAPRGWTGFILPRPLRPGQASDPFCSTIEIV